MYVNLQKLETRKNYIITIALDPCAYLDVVEWNVYLKLIRNLKYVATDECW
jgi:hypothetical protein